MSEATMNPYEQYMCKYTNKLYNEPVIANDGYVFEKEYLINLFSDKDTIISPNTNQEMKKGFILFVKMNKILDEFFIKHPEMLPMRYVTKTGIVAKFREMVQNHTVSTEEIISFVELNKDIDFTTDFPDNAYAVNRFFCAIRLGKINYLKTFISIDINLYKKNTIIDGTSPLQYAFDYDNIEVIKYFFSIDKNIYNNIANKNSIIEYAKTKLSPENYIKFLELVVENM